ncbi:gamma-glutamyltransferase [Parasaccharibacter sp. TMW 2.1888]|uniref:gamma-glutamyltransferase n=1 Tax=Parasaccharibacter sp. TMW 2.1888 TaxID=2268025 RepID=UPI00201463EE|nr:gamma-glutamyltransferase [Parasaccharibacter sp. TMW 2.1888]
MVKPDSRTPHPPCLSDRPTPRWARGLGLLACLSLLGSSLVACSGGRSLKHHLFGHTAPSARANTGIVVADEPQAALVGRDVLARGGNAADAATATAFALSVTLPSRASLGGGGACLVARPGQPAESISFLPVDGTGTGGDRPAAVPMMARGLFLLNLRYGSVQLGDTIDPAITLGQQGITVSRQLASDIAAVQGPLLSNEGMKALFSRGDSGVAIREGDQLTQPRLTSFLSRLKLVGVGDLYTGALSDVFVTQANKAGAGLTRDDLRRSLPGQTSALHFTSGPYRLSFLAPPADGGLGSAAAFRQNLRAENVISAWRRSGRTSLQEGQIFMASGQSDATGLPPLPASTSFVVRDGHGLSVGCVLTDNNLFGTGRLAGSTGVVLAGAPHDYPRPLLSAAILEAPHKRMQAVLAASGQNDAAQSVADALRQLAQGQAIAPSTGTGQLNSIVCSGDDCVGQAAPNGNGLTAHTITH